MTDVSQIIVNSKTYQKLLNLKEEMGFGNKEWDVWFEEIFDNASQNDTLNSTIEKIFENAAYEKYYDNWIKNFAHNLPNIWNGNSAKILTPDISNESNLSSAIVIGRGPSIKKHGHLQLLASSQYSGTLVCTDGALENVLSSGITPDKFEKFFVITIDTQDHVKNFYTNDLAKQYGKKIKCILSSTVPLSTYDAIKESGIEIYWIHTLFDYNKGKSSFNYISNVMTKNKTKEKGLPGIQTGGNVGASAWVVAWSILKCSPISLIGIDLGYPEEMTWDEINQYHKLPDGIDKNSKSFKKAFPTVYNPDFNCYTKQDPKFQFYCNALKEFIPKAPNWVKTINATEGGALFGEKIECMRFKNFLEKFPH